MNTKQITIRMPKARLENWLKALRSGEYKQAHDTLYDARNKSYCCLGVEQHCNGARITRNDGVVAALPSSAYLARNKIVFMDKYGDATSSPFLPALKTEAAEANDDGVPFHEIANAIEACAEGV